MRKNRKKEERQRRNFWPRLALNTGEALMALLFGAVTLNLFVYAFSILFGVELFVRVDDVYLASAGFFAQFQSPNLFTLAAREFVLGSVSLAPLSPAVVGAGIWWMFGRPAVRRLISRSPRPLRPGDRDHKGVVQRRSKR